MGPRGSATPAVEVLYEDNHLLALCKPALTPTMGAPAGVASLLTVAKEYIARKYNKPGNVYLGVVSRLDAPVTGVVLMARTSKAAARLSASFRNRDVEKTYLAAVAEPVNPPAADLEHYLAKDERHRRVYATHAKSPAAQVARLSYETLAATPQAALLKIHLETGRKHQIRVQLARVGRPILGDRKYGSTRDFPHGIALHARRLALEHPVRREPLIIEAPMPDSWRQHRDVRTLLDHMD